MSARGIHYRTLDLYTRPRDDLLRSVGPASTLLYVDDKQGVCDTCSKQYGSCIGHILYHELRHTHVHPAYADTVNQLFGCICPKCKQLERNIPPSATQSRHILYNKLAAHVLDITQQCNCVDKSKTPKWDEVALVEYLRKMADMPATDYLPKLGLPPARMLLCRYYPIISHKVISVMLEAKNLNDAYTGLLNVQKCQSRDTEAAMLASVYKYTNISISGKEGICRRFIGSVNQARSARGVIVSNPDLAVNEVGVAPRIARALVTEMDVTEDTLESVVDMITQSRVQRLRHRGERYKVSSSECKLVCSNDEGCYVVTPGLQLAIDGVVHTLYSNNVYMLYTQVLRATEVVLPALGVSVIPTATYIAVSCLRPHVDGMQMDVPVIVGCSAVVVADRTPVNVSRNPVLGANSLRRFVAVRGTTECVSSLSTTEKYYDKYVTSQIIQTVALAPVTHTVAEGSVTDRVTLHLLPQLPTTSKGVVCLGLANHVPLPPPGEYVDNDVTIKINPITTPGYNADFDGDEENLVVTHCADPTTSIVPDMLRMEGGKPVYYPNHDGKYGLWVFAQGKGKLQARLRDAMRDFDNTYVAEEVDRKSLPRYTSMRDAIEVEAEVKKANRCKARLVQWRQLLQSMPGVFTNVYVADFYMALLDANLHDTIANVANYNRAVVAAYEAYLNHEEYRCMYDCTTEQGIASYYAHVTKTAYAFCDAYGMTIDYEGVTAKHIVESGARTSVETYMAVYHAVGNVKYMLPGDRTFRTHIKGNYMSGLSPQEHVHLAHQSRASGSKKARMAAPEGDIMRHTCEYVTAFEATRYEWRRLGNRYYTHRPTSIPLHERLANYVAETHIYRRELDLANRPFSYMPKEDIPVAVYNTMIPKNHRGQLKLLLSELEFLTQYARHDTLLVYAGAASGSHLLPLLILFPKLTMHLYDTADFCKELHSHSRVTVFKEYLTPDVVAARGYRNHDHVLFCSDIRTDHGDVGVDEDNVVADNELTLRLVKDINAYASIIKFRCPFVAGTTTTFEGRILQQAWTSAGSSETRIWCERPYRTVQIDNKAYEDAMFCHNLRRRCKYADTHVLPAMELDLRREGIAIGYDAILHTEILNAYANKYDTTAEEVYKLIVSYRSCSTVV